MSIQKFRIQNIWNNKDSRESHMLNSVAFLSLTILCLQRFTKTAAVPFKSLFGLGD